MPDLQDLGAFDDAELPLPDNFYDDYEGRPAAAAQEMEIDRHMDLVYDLKMADKEGEIHTGSELEEYGRAMYSSGGDGKNITAGHMTPEQKAVWDAYYDPIIEQFKADSLTGKALAEWKYRRYMSDYLSVIRSVDRNIGRVLDYLMESGLWDNTLVIYTSDQGFYMGAPTFLEMAGVPVPDDIQGESYLSFLRTGKVEKGKHWRKSLYYHFYEYPGEHAATTESAPTAINSFISTATTSTPGSSTTSRRIPPRCTTSTETAPTAASRRNCTGNSCGCRNSTTTPWSRNWLRGISKIQ